MKNSNFDDKISMVGDKMIADRIKKISSFLEGNEAIIIENDANRFYFTGFNSSAGMVIITSQKAFFLIDFRYYEKAKKLVKHCEVILATKIYSQVSEIFSNNGVKNVFVETGNISIKKYNEYKQKFDFVAVSDEDKIEKEIYKMRSIKDNDELENIRRAQALTDDTFNYILNRIKAGVSERELMLDMEFYMRKSGSEGIAFDFIVVSGKNSSLPHGVPTDKKIEVGDFVTMDFGAVVNGYRSDMTRTVAIGTVSQEQQRVYDTVLKAQKKAINFIKSGVKCCDADKVARDIIDSAGYSGCFGHSLGHSVGIEIHELPNCSPKSEDILLPGTVMTVEPGIYIENKFGVRIEDMVLVTEDGCSNLTHSPKELIII